MVEVGRYRRIVAIAVFVASSVALLATSYAPIESRLVARHHGSVVLTADAPRAVGRVRLDLSAQATPGPEAGQRFSGDVRFSTDQRLGDVVLAVSPVGHDALPVPEFDGLTFPIGQVCRVAEPCEVEFDVVLEWASPVDDTLATSFIAELEIIYHEVEQNPDGASASWSETSELAGEADGPFVSATTEPERVTLDESAWAVSRHVMVAASEAARTGVISVLVGIDGTLGGSNRVLVTVLPDGPGQAAIGVDEPFNPFADCPSNDRCERGLTVTFELDGESQEKPAIFEWQTEIRAAFPATQAVPDGATVEAAVDSSVALSDTTPQLVESLAGSIALALDPTAGGSSTVVTLRIDVSAGGLPVRGFAGVPATSLAKLSLASAREARVEIGVDAGDLGVDVGTLKIGPDRPGTLLFNPLRSCALERACSRWVTARVTAEEAEDQSPFEVTWALDLEVAYPGLSEVPASVDLTLLVDPRSE